MTIIAKQQTAGKGQRGHHWLSEPGENLLMSIIITPFIPIEKQFLLSASVAVGVCESVNTVSNNELFTIKWPNDLIINDRKAGGILIENIIRGSHWLYSVIGIGINVLQIHFPQQLPFATSLKKEINIDISIHALALKIRQQIFQNLAFIDEKTFDTYRKMLYKYNCPQKFLINGNPFTAVIKNIHENGQLMLELGDGTISSFNHGAIEWVWE